MISKINAISSVIATENWIIKTTPYTVHFAHQSDTALIAVKVNKHFFYITYLDQNKNSNHIFFSE